MLNNPRPRSYRSKLISQNLGGLGAEYDPVVVTITARQENITLQKVQFLLISYGSRLAQHNLLASIDLINASANYNRIRGNNSRGGSREGRGRGNNNNRFENKIVCQLCSKGGHMVTTCFRGFDHSFSRTSTTTLLAILESRMTV
ncbi:hypothetical protein ACOSP7_011523 [Xanthoceras sorbifolium]